MGIGFELLPKGACGGIGVNVGGDDDGAGLDVVWDGDIGRVANDEIGGLFGEVVPGYLFGLGGLLDVLIGNGVYVIGYSQNLRVEILNQAIQQPVYLLRVGAVAVGRKYFGEIFGFGVGGFGCEVVNNFVEQFVDIGRVQSVPVFGGKVVQQLINS